jgi:hypothetical protein
LTETPDIGYTPDIMGDQIKTSLYVEKGLWLRARGRAIGEGRSMTEVVRQLLEGYCAQNRAMGDAVGVVPKPKPVAPIEPRKETVLEKAQRLVDEEENWHACKRDVCVEEECQGPEHYLWYAKRGLVNRKGRP